MRPQYNNEQLILTIKRACSVPTSQFTYRDSDWVAMATDVLQTIVIPLVMATREEYFVTFEDVQSPVDGIIPFPEAAVGSKLRSVCYVSQPNPPIVINLPRIDLDVVAGVGAFNMGTLAGFYIQGSNIVLYPNGSVPTNTTIRLYYYKRSLVLAEPENYGQVQSVDPMTNTLVLDVVPNSWEVGMETNSIGPQPNFDITSSGYAVTALSSPSLILDSVDGIEVGDYLSEIGYSAIPQIPIEAMNYLAQLTAAKALEGLGDREGMKAAKDEADILKQSLLVMISQRVDGSIKKIVNPSGGLRLACGTWPRYRGW